MQNQRQVSVVSVCLPVHLCLVTAVSLALSLSGQSILISFFLSLHAFIYFHFFLFFLFRRAVNNASIYTGMLFQNRENNNENAEQTMRIDIGGVGGGSGAVGGTAAKLEPEKTKRTSICTLSTSKIPASGLCLGCAPTNAISYSSALLTYFIFAVQGIRSVRVQQHYVKYDGDVVNPIQSAVLRSPCDNYHVNRDIKVAAMPPSVISSSSAVITSSASNHSFALSEQNDEKSSSQCSRRIGGTATGAQKTDGSGSSTAVVRHTNKYLTENSIRLIELRNPGMTTQERVLNWKIADEFSDVEDDFDESRYTQSQPFRSERVSKNKIDRNNLQEKPAPKMTETDLDISVAETHLQETRASRIVVGIVIDCVICEAKIK